MAAYITYGLTRCGKIARLLAGTAGMLAEEVATIRAGDAFVVVSQSPYSRDAELFGFRALVAQMCLAQVLGTLRAMSAAGATR